MADGRVKMLGITGLLSRMLRLGKAVLGKRKRRKEMIGSGTIERRDIDGDSSSGEDFRVRT
jgi:hypothetical protein